MPDFFNQNEDQKQSEPIDLSPPAEAFGSGVDASPKGVLHRLLGKLGTASRVLAILVIGGAMLATIGFGGYRYVSSSVAEMLKNPYDTANAADDLAGITDMTISGIPGTTGSSGTSSSGGTSSNGSTGNSGSSSSSGSDSDPDTDAGSDSGTITIIGNNTTIPVVTPTNQNTVHNVVSSAGFTHPGVMVSLGQLNTTKDRIAKKQAPWTDVALLAMNSSAAVKAPTLTNMVQLADLSKSCNYKSPGSGCVVNCGYNSNPNFGCKDETGDAIAAYTQSLLWYYTGNESYAQSAITILNGWSSVLRGHAGANRAVQLAWAAESFTRAAEIIRYTYTPTAGKASLNQDQFNTMLQTAFVPTLNSYGYSGYNGNWNLSAIDAKMNVAVYTDNRAMYNTALSQWRTAVPAYIYLKSDGAIPKEPAGGTHSGKTELSCFWLSNKVDSCKTTPKSDPNLNFQNGQIQETCRDLVHVSMGLGAMLNTAETASIQGTDLYGEQQTRIMTGLAYTAEIGLALPVTGYPAGICNGIHLTTASVGLPFEEAYNAYVVRKGQKFPIVSIPNLPSRGYDNNDPVLTKINLNMQRHAESVGLTTAWETLTHYQSGW